MTRIAFRLLPCAALALLLAGCTPSGQKAGSPAALPQATAPAIEPAASQSAAQAAPAPPTVSPQQKRINDLIAQVEAAYAAGNTDYRKGRLPQAKVQFDHAVDLMLTSGLDIKGNPQLLDEFNRVVDQVNALEMEALQQGNGFAPKVEPSPADVANDVTFKVDPNFVARAKTDLATTHSDLPLVMNDYVASYINFFANTQRGHNTLLHAFQRSGRYRAMIQRVMAEEGVPQDLIYLAVAESGFQPRALNASSHAGGMWQFMPSNDYGLVRNRYVDQRFDPEKSTRAYARYMKFLYNQLGDWYLAMAAYDHGAGNIQRAVARTGYASFWQLYKRHELPTETENYVPEILAAIIIASHPRQYGFDDITLDPPVITDTVSIDYSVDLRLVSDLVDTPVSELAALNPSLLGYLTPPDMAFDLHLPAGTASLFEQRIAQIPESKRDSWRYHRVATGDTLASVAQYFHVSISELAATNQLGIHDSLDGVQTLIVPVARSASHSLRYTVRRGDTLISIADRFGVSLSDLRRWNHLRGNVVRTGRHIYVAEPLRPTRSRHHSTHRRSSSHHSSITHRKSAASRKKHSTSSHSTHKRKKTEKKN